MGKDSTIEWTDHTFNPWVGCQKVSDGCKFCYAERDMTRKPRWANSWGPPETSKRLRTKNWGNPIRWNRDAQDRNERYKVFCASLADVFEDNPQVAGWRRELFILFEQTPQLDWLVLTKRPENVVLMLEAEQSSPDARTWFARFPNIWGGASIENQKTADERLPHLARIPATVRWLSAEPLLGPIDLGLMGTAPKSWGYAGYRPVWTFFHWVIVGGESGPDARPTHPEWVRSLQDQCREANIPFFFKQWGEYAPTDIDPAPTRFADGQGMVRVGRKRAGHLLDGKEWHEFPE